MAEANMMSGSEAVAHNLDQADKTQALNGSVHAATEAHGGPAQQGGHAEPKALGMDATAWVSLAMLVFIVLLLVKKVPSLIGGALDGRIAEIRKQLDEASKLRKEAEALKAEYEGKLKAATAEAEAIRTHAEEEAGQIVADAKTSAADLVMRRIMLA
jgi:F-type H+-transporting ATPase subunit b